MRVLRPCPADPRWALRSDSRPYHPSTASHYRAETARVSAVRGRASNRRHSGQHRWSCQSRCQSKGASSLVTAGLVRQASLLRGIMADQVAHMDNPGRPPEPGAQVRVLPGAPTSPPQRKPGPPAPATPKPPRTAGGTGSGRRGKGATGPDGASAAREARAKGRSGRAGPTGTGEGTNRHGPEQRDREGSDPTAEPPDTPPGHGEPGAHTGRRGPPTGRAHRGAAEPPRTAGGPPGTEHRRRRGGKRTRRALRAVERPLGRVLPGRHAGVRTACDR